MYSQNDIYSAKYDQKCAYDESNTLWNDLVEDVEAGMTGKQTSLRQR